MNNSNCQFENKLPNLSGKKILITGGLGFIGSNVAIKCVELGGEVTIYDCLDPFSGGNLYNIKGIERKIILCKEDILDYEKLSEHVDGKNIIINCAASTSHARSMTEPWMDTDVNARGAVNLLEAIRTTNCGVKLVHLGSTTQLGILQYQPADEKHPEFPTDISSANKCVSEKYVLIYAKAYGIRACVLRLSNVYGPRASIHSAAFTFNNYFIGLALNDENITVFGPGKQKRNLIYIDDVVTAILRSAVEDKTDGETFFLVGDNHYSVAEIANAIVTYIESGSVTYVEWPKERKAIEVGDAIISNEKLKKTIGWRPAVDLKEGLEKTRKYYSKCTNHYLR